MILTKKGCVLQGLESEEMFVITRELRSVLSGNPESPSYPQCSLPLRGTQGVVSGKLIPYVIVTSNKQVTKLPLAA